MTPRGGARPNAGRPRKPAAEKRRNPIPGLLTDGERAELEAAAKARDVTAAEFARGLVVRSLRRRRK